MIINNKYYSIVKTGIDDYKLTIKATKREIDFKRDLNFMKKVQSCNAKGRILMIKQLKESGLTKDDLIERKETTRVTSASLEDTAIKSLDGVSPDKQVNKKLIVNKEPSIGRNDPCICGSGKKYKNCCGK